MFSYRLIYWSHGVLDWQKRPDSVATDLILGTRLSRLFQSSCQRKSVIQQVCFCMLLVDSDVQHVELVHSLFMFSVRVNESSNWVSLGIETSQYCMNYITGWRLERICLCKLMILPPQRHDWRDVLWRFFLYLGVMPLFLIYWMLM